MLLYPAVAQAVRATLRCSCFVVAVTLLVIALPYSSMADKGAPPAAPGELIVKYNKAALLRLKGESADLGSYSVDAIREALDSLLNTERKDTLDLIEAELVKIEEGKELDLSFLSDLYEAGLIEYIEPNYQVTLDSTPNDASFSSLWGLHNTGQSGGTVDVDIDAPEAWSTTTGSSNVVVAVIDTGVDYTHPDLVNNMWVNTAEASGSPGTDDDGNGVIDDVYGYNAISDNGDPMDDHNHGTHCAGTIGASGNNSVGVAGVNWNVKIMALKFLDNAGAGYTSDAIKAIDYAINMKTRGVNVRVLSNSWGGGAYQQSLHEAMERASDANMLVVAAAGNEGSNNDSYPTYPANYEVSSLLSVAAIDRNGSLASFSNYGAENVHVAAPGVSILSTVRGGGYANFNGTSMAAPHVSGAAALILSNSPSLSATGLRSLLMNSTKSLASLEGKVSTSGLISVGRAISGEVNYPPSIQPISNITMNQATYVLTIQASDEDGDSLSYSASVDTADSLAYQLDASLDLWTTGDYYFNSWGYQEKWIRDSTGKWYFIKPGGLLHRFDNVDSVPLLATLETRHYDDPLELCEAQTSYSPPAELSFAGKTLTIEPMAGFVGSFDVDVAVSDGNVISHEEFSVTVVENNPPQISAIGDMTVLENTTVQLVLAASDEDGDAVSLSASANSSSVSASVVGNILKLTFAEGYNGAFNVTVSASDGVLTAEEVFEVQVIDLSDSRAETLDCDGDGVSDLREIADGTDVYDSGSFKSQISNPTHALWNGFLGMENILELVNVGLGTAKATVSMYSIEGVLQHQTRVAVSPQGQADLILNAMPGFQANSYGIVKVEFSGELDGRLSYYKADAWGGYEFAFSVPFMNSSFGDTSVSFNTFQPSANPADSANVVQNWLSVVNLSSDYAWFTVNSYDQQGALLRTVPLKVPSFGRVDVDGGHGFAGSGVVGMHEILPADDSKPYMAQLIRYGGNAQIGQLATNYQFAFPLLARAGNGRPVHMPISRMFGGDNWVEISNALSTRERVTVTFRNSAGAEVFQQRFWLDAHSQIHFNAAAYLNENESGLATVESDSLSSIVAQSMFYFRDSVSGSIQAMYGIQAHEALGTNMIGSYNLYLGMENWLKISNTESSPQSVTVVTTGPAGSSEQNFVIAANASLDIPLHQNSSYSCAPCSYGSVVVTSGSGNAVVSELVRARSAYNGLDFVMPTLVR